MKCHLDAWPMFSGYVSFKEGKTFETLRKFMNYLSYKRASTALYFLSNLQHSINHLSMWLSYCPALFRLYIFTLESWAVPPNITCIYIYTWSFRTRCTSWLIYSCCTAHVFVWLLIFSWKLDASQNLKRIYQWLFAKPQEIIALVEVYQWIFMDIRCIYVSMILK